MEAIYRIYLQKERAFGNKNITVTEIAKQEKPFQSQEALLLIRVLLQTKTFTLLQTDTKESHLQS